MMKEAFPFLLLLLFLLGNVTIPRKVSAESITSNFTIDALPRTQTVIMGDAVDYKIIVNSVNASPSINLNISGLPVGAVFSFTPRLVSPNATSTLHLTVSESVSSGSYNLTVIGTRNNVTYTTNVILVVVALTGQVAQTKTNTITFSWSNTLTQSKSFSVSGVGLGISARVDVSLTMPVSLQSKSNDTVPRANSTAWIRLSMSSGTASIRISGHATASIGSTTQSVDQNWEKSFTTPLGVSSEILFPQVSFPAIDAGIGKITIDLTPKASLVGSIVCNITGVGSCEISKHNLQWDNSGSEKSILVMINEEQHAEVDLYSSVLTIQQLNIGANIGASLVPIFGSTTSFALGSLTFPVQSNIPLSGSPNSVAIAEYSVPNIQGNEENNGNKIASPSVNVYWVLIAVASISIPSAIGVYAIKRRKPKTEFSGLAEKSTHAQEKSHLTVSRASIVDDANRALVSYNYSTGALCCIDNYPLDESGRVLQCPKCGALFHEDCLRAYLEITSVCPKCGHSLTM